MATTTPTTEAEILRTEIARVLARANPPAIMALEDVADFFGMSYNYVRNELQHRPDFPAKLERFKQPRWSRAAILEYAGVAA